MPKRRTKEEKKAEIEAHNLQLLEAAVKIEYESLINRLVIVYEMYCDNSGRSASFRKDTPVLGRIIPHESFEAFYSECGGEWEEEGPWNFGNYRVKLVDPQMLETIELFADINESIHFTILGPAKRVRHDGSVGPYTLGENDEDGEGFHLIESEAELTEIIEKRKLAMAAQRYALHEPQKEAPWWIT